MILEEFLDGPKVGKEVLHQVGEVVDLVADDVLPENGGLPGFLDPADLFVYFVPFAGQFLDPCLGVRIYALGKVLHLKQDTVEARLRGGVSTVLHGEQILQPTEGLFRVPGQAEDVLLLFLIINLGQVTVILVAPFVQVFLRKALGGIEVFQFPHLLDVLGQGRSEFLLGRLDHPPLLEGLQKEANHKGA